MKKTAPDNQMCEIILETDIGRDYGDFISLCFCFCHPRIDLKGILLTPGYPDQIYLVQKILHYFGREDVPLGTLKKNIKKDKKWVNLVHFEILKKMGVVSGDSLEPDLSNMREGGHLMERLLNLHYRLIYVSISPLKNFRVWFDRFDTPLEKTYSLGGYHGEEKLGQKSLKKEYNLSGDRWGSHRLMNAQNLSKGRIERRVLVSKNITHHVFYDKDLNSRVKEKAEECKGYKLIYEIMERWFKNHTKDNALDNNEPRKRIQDPLALCVCLDESIVDLIEVQPYIRNKKFGSYRMHDTGCFITFGHEEHLDQEQFRKIFLSDA